MMLPARKYLAYRSNTAATDISSDLQRDFLREWYSNPFPGSHQGKALGVSIYLSRNVLGYVI